MLLYNLIRFPAINDVVFLCYRSMDCPLHLFVDQFSLRSPFNIFSPQICCRCSADIAPTSLRVGPWLIDDFASGFERHGKEAFVLKFSKSNLSRNSIDKLEAV